MADNDALIDAILNPGRAGADGANATPGEYDAQGNRRAVGRVGRSAARVSTPRRRMLRLRREQACIEQIGRLPARGEELLMILDGRWHGWDLVGAIMELAGRTVTQIHVATLGFNRSQTFHLTELIDGGRIKRATMLVSEVFREKDRDDYALLFGELARRGQTVAATRNHAKLILFQFDDRSTLAAHGSLNLRRCNAFEQIALTSDPKTHAFFRAYIQEQTGTQPAPARRG